MVNYIEKINIGQQVLTNSDGTNWSEIIQSTELGNHNWHTFAYGDGKYVAVSYQNYYVSTSNNGIDWTQATQEETLHINSPYWVGITYFRGNFFAISDMGYVSSTTDGITWTTPSSAFPNVLPAVSNIANGNGMLMAIGQGGYYNTSLDGITWGTPIQDSNMGTGHNWDGLAFGKGKFVALGNDGYVSIYTSNGQEPMHWTQATQNSNLSSHQYWRALTYANGKFIAISSDGYVSTSVDGENWSVPIENTNLGNNGWRDIIYVNGKYTSLGYHGYLSVSSSKTSDIPIGGNNFDGGTHYIHTPNFYESTMTANQIMTLNVAPYLPDSTHTYELLVDGQFTTGKSSGNACGIQVASGTKSSADNTFYYLGRANTRSSSNHTFYFCGWVQINPNDQNFTIYNYDASGTSGTLYIHAKAYRRLGYNNDSSSYLEKIKIGSEVNNIPFGGKSQKGQWQKVQWNIYNGTFSASETKSFDLTTFGLPNDDYTYRVIISMYGITTSTSGRAVNLSACPSHASFVQVLSVNTRSSSTELTRNSVQLDILPHDRTLQVCSASGNTTGNTIINITGYRRLGNNE